MSKKAKQLGMNPSTASGRLVKDLLFASIVDKDFCYHCGKPMTRKDFSIEHKTPWLDSEKPAEMFFDLNNIAFSHLSCNSAEARRVRQTEHGTSTMYQSGCRCDECRLYESDKKKRNYANRSDR